MIDRSRKPEKIYQTWNLDCNDEAHQKNRSGEQQIPMTCNISGGRGEARKSWKNHRPSSSSSTSDIRPP
ncbi:hypothetical protein TIFTF001_054499 [Ficus carica]|uniref:Uncharacterized protein n=1 Tax=Ficus carica TaxID=3494 RepID=A0AA88EI78_FICCA|nr:hypothetical protein TIFTF001_054499 [Ficus carica]